MAVTSVGNLNKRPLALQQPSTPPLFSYVYLGRPLTQVRAALELTTTTPLRTFSVISFPFHCPVIDSLDRFPPT